MPPAISTGAIATVIGSTGAPVGGVLARASASAGRSAPRWTTLAIPHSPTKMLTARMTLSVPTTSAIGATMMIGARLAIETSMFRTPKTRPRTSSGNSSWSWVWDAIETIAKAKPMRNAMTTTRDSTETTRLASLI